MLQRIVLILIFCLLSSGCATYILNQPLESYESDQGYRFPEIIEDDSPDTQNSDSLFVCLAFSGGGTRAAAFAYGVLEKLHKTPIQWEGKTSSLLDEVDCISGISGGSFTAAYFGLFGKRIFQDFRMRFLNRDIQGELLARALNPLNWPRLASPKFNRIDLATELYNETLFDGKTFDDLVARGKRPFIIINATDLVSGQSFEFTQNQFDFLGSDLGKLPVARAVSASSAFPFLLSPVSLKNYTLPPEFSTPEDIAKGLKNYDYNRRLWHWAIRHYEYLNKSERPYIHLMDGGLSDNIGMRAIENEYRRSGGFIRQRINSAGRKSGIKKLVFIVANARTESQDKISKSDIPPEISEVGFKTATIALDNYSFETIESMRDLVNQRRQTQDTLAQCNRKIQECPSVQPFPQLSREIEPIFIDLNFEAHPDPKIKKELQSLPTSFVLPEEAVNQLIRAGEELLENSDNFQKLRQKLQPDAPD